MMVVVDTPVWSLALRRSSGPTTSREPLAAELQQLIEEGRVALLGPIRQEILSGLRDTRQLDELRSKLRAFPDVEISTTDYETAASYYYTCGANGVQGSHTDFLICAVASARGHSVFTTDVDFARYARFVPVALHEVKRSHRPPDTLPGRP